MHFLRIVPVLAIALTVGACSSGAGSAAPPATPVSSRAATTPPPAPATPAATSLAATAASPAPTTPAATSPAIATRIAVNLTDTLDIEPARMTVPAGVPITFVVTNAGVLEHEFYLGDGAAQAAHDQEMAAGGMAHDDPEGIGVDPGATREMTYTFGETGETLAGCHVVGHYAAGMRAAITVVPQP